MSPDIFRHEDVAFQVPTTLPPQADTFGQLIEPPEPDPMPALFEPPEPPVPPLGLPPPEPPVAPRPAEPPVPPPESVLQPVPAAVVASARTLKIRRSRSCMGFFQRAGPLSASFRPAAA